MQKEKKNKLSFKEKATMKMLMPLIDKCINVCYETTIQYLSDESIKPTKDEYMQIILNKLKGE